MSLTGTSAQRLEDLINQDNNSSLTILEDFIVSDIQVIDEDGYNTKGTFIPNEGNDQSIRWNRLSLDLFPQNEVDSLFDSDGSDFPMSSSVLISTHLNNSSSILSAEDIVVEDLTPDENGDVTITAASDSLAWISGSTKKIHVMNP